MTFFNTFRKVQKQFVGPIAFAGLLCAGVAPVSARDFYSYTAKIECGNQGWILQAAQAPGVANPKARLISQGNAVEGAYNDDSKTYVFKSSAYGYQVMLQDDGSANLTILDRTGSIVEEEECTYGQ